METFDKSVSLENPTNLPVHNDNLVEQLHENATNMKTNQQRFTSSVTINKFKIFDRDISIIVKSEDDAAEATQRFYNTSLLHNTLKTGEGDMRITIESSSQNYAPSAANNPASRVTVDSSDTLRFNIEHMRLRAEEKRLELERMDAEFRKTDRGAWLKIKQQEMELRKLEIEKEIKELEVRKLELSDPKDLKEMKIKVRGNLVKHTSEGSEMPRSVKLPSENYVFSGEIFINQEQDTVEPPTANVFGETIEVEKVKFCEILSAEESQEELKTREHEASWNSILKNSVILDNLELSYGLTGHLIEDGLLDPKAQEDIQREGKTRYEKCDRLLDYIDNSNLTSFLDGLRKTMQSHLAEFIDCSLYKTKPKPEKSGDWPLNEEERKTINKLYVLLVKDIPTNEVLDGLLSEDCISELHKEGIDGCGVKSKRNRELLDIMRRRSKEQLKTFWKLVIKYSKHLKDIIEKFLVPGNTLTLVKVHTQENLSEAQKQKVKGNLNQPRRRFSTRDGDEPTGSEKVNFCVSGEEIFAVVQAEEAEIDPSSMIVSEEMKSMVEEALISCTGGDEVIVKTLENVEYLENKTMNESDWSRLLKNCHVQSFTSEVRNLSGIAIHNNEVYMTSYDTPYILVYSLQNLSTVSRQFSVPGLISARGLVYNESDSCLYTSDYSIPGHIYKINTRDDSVTGWDTQTGQPWGLSISKQKNILVSYTSLGQIDEFNGSAQLIRSIKLTDDITGINHSIELETGEFIVCQCRPLHRICLVNFSGKVIKSYGKKRGSGVGQLNDLIHIELDQRGNILVSDNMNNKLRVMTSDLKYVADVNITDTQFKYPTCTCWDKENDRLLVTTSSNNFYVITPQTL